MSLLTLSVDIGSIGVTGDRDSDINGDSNGDGDSTGIVFCLFFATFAFLFTFFLGGYKIAEEGIDWARFCLGGFGVQPDDRVGCCWGAIRRNTKISI